MRTDAQPRAATMTPPMRPAAPEGGRPAGGLGITELSLAARIPRLSTPAQATSARPSGVTKATPAGARGHGPMR